MCVHPTACPEADAENAGTAQEVAWQRDLGWTLLCNGVLLVEDRGDGALGDGSADPDDLAELCTPSLADLGAEAARDLQAAFDGWRWILPPVPVQEAPPQARVAPQIGDHAG